MWGKLRKSHWRYFPIYLLLIFISEMAGNYANYSGHFTFKVGLYNYFVIPLEILFFIWFFYMEMRFTKFKLIPIAGALLYAACWGVDKFIIAKQPFWWLHSFSYVIGILVMLILILFFLYKLSLGEDILLIGKNMMFWVCLGLFVFYFFTLPFFGIGNYLFSKHPGVYISYAQFTYFFNYIMYGFFIIAFIWGIPKYSFSSQSSA